MDAPSIGEQLAQALAMTENLLLAQRTREQVARVIAARAPLLAAAEALRRAGEPWGEPEATLARRILAADAKILAELWDWHKDSFTWLQERDPSIVLSLPCLASLAAQRPGQARERGALAAQNDRPGHDAMRATAAWQYARTGALR